MIIFGEDHRSNVDSTKYCQRMSNRPQSPVFHTERPPKILERSASFWTYPNFLKTVQDRWSQLGPPFSCLDRSPTRGI